jgi:hypothetical protein
MTVANRRYEGDATPLLLGGDTNDDYLIDINDVTWFIYQYADFAADGGCPWNGTRDADFNNGGTVGAEDYTFFTTNWLEYSICDCGRSALEPDREGSPDRTLVDMKTTIRTSKLSPDVAAVVDLNDDGIVDFKDVRMLEKYYDLGDSLSTKMEATTRRAAPAGRNKGS